MLLSKENAFGIMASYFVTAPKVLNWRRNGPPPKKPQKGRYLSSFFGMFAFLCKNQNISLVLFLQIWQNIFTDIPIDFLTEKRN
jgi:hypothetical protein